MLSGVDVEEGDPVTERGTIKDLGHQLVFQFSLIVAIYFVPTRVMN
jgi:hypothetical protein